MAEAPWLMLIHQIPPKPDYFRVKIRRRLQSLGAVAIKNSVYVLPNTEQAQEDFQWLLAEIKAGGGDAMVCEAHFVEGLSDEQIQGSFRAARDEEYAEIAEEARKLLKALSARGSGSEERAEFGGQILRLKRRQAEVTQIDFFEAPGRQEVEKLLSELEGAIRKARSGPKKVAKGKAHLDPHREFRARTWVTRKGIHVDRMASAWLVRRFVDPKAQFKFVLSAGYSPKPGEIRFDMFEAEFTHEGDKCTFEVLRDRLQLADRALGPIGEIVHDIDLKDSKFGRQEALGIARLIAGIAMAYKDDETRLQRGLAVFEDLYQYFTRQREASPAKS